jgi:o-succinylbenzoate synthase
MMIIKECRCIPVKIPLATPFKYAKDNLASLDYCFVILTCKVGRKTVEGYGECSIAPNVTGETQASVIAFFEIIRKRLIGKHIEDLASIEVLLAGLQDILYNQAAKAGLDIALLDALGKAQKKTVGELLGKVQRHSITYQEVIPFIAEEERDLFLMELQKKIKDGLTQVKIKVGYNDLYDEEIVQSVRSLSSGIRISLDVNQGWKDHEHARAMIKQLQRYDMAWFEQPVLNHDWAALSKLNDIACIMADESIQTYEDIVAYTESHNIDMVNIKVAKCGGLLEAKKIVEHCKQHGIKVFLGSMIESNIGTSANLHLASVCDFVSSDVGAYQFVATPYVAGIQKCEQQIQVPRGEGLGVHLPKNQGTPKTF